MKCYTEIQCLGHDGGINISKPITVTLKNHHFIKKNNKEICKKCGVVLSVEGGTVRGIE